MTPVEARTRIRTFQIEQIARVAAKLAAVPERDGTMLDNTLIVYLSDAAEQHHGVCLQWPFVLVGGLGKTLKRTKGGRYLHYTGYERDGTAITPSPISTTACSTPSATRPTNSDGWT